MRVHELRREQLVPRPLGETFAFFAQARNLERITPPWLRFAVLTPAPIEMRTGTVIEYRLRLHGLPLRWTARIEDWREGRAFADRQIRGPYRLWHHRHEFEAVEGGTRVRDVVHYALPLGPLGELARLVLVRRDLERIFAFRRAAVQRLATDGDIASVA
jgi:ligand-binding SRPBCC domain-containing protein